MRPPLCSQRCSGLGPGHPQAPGVPTRIQGHRKEEDGVPAGEALSHPHGRNARATCWSFCPAVTVPGGQEEVEARPGSGEAGEGGREGGQDGWQPGTEPAEPKGEDTGQQRATQTCNQAAEMGRGGEGWVTSGTSSRCRTLGTVVGPVCRWQN